jgi:PE family
MSYVITEPELVQGAAQDLAGIRESLAEATSTVSGPTTAIAAAGQDEISIAIASMFGNFGQNFQALSAQARAFHEQFVGLLSQGAGAYVSAEAANAGRLLLGGGQDLGGAVTAIQNGSAAALVSGQIQADVEGISGAIARAPAAAPMLIQGINAFGAGVAAPYQALGSNTVTNLQAIGRTFTANPFPFLHQLGSGQIGSGQMIAPATGTGSQNLPSELANMPANIQVAIQGASTSNPGASLQQFINGQIATAQTISTSLQTAAQDINAGLPTLSAGFHGALQSLFAGNPIGAYGDLNQALVSALLPGFSGTQVGPGPVGSLGEFLVTPMGPLGALGPIFDLPGQMAQNFVTLLPPGSIAAQIAQNAANVISVGTNFNTTLDVLGLTTANLSFGAPVQLIFDSLGGPANALSALNSTGVAFVGAVQAGNGSAAAAALLDAPAVIANGYLNGTTFITLPSTGLTIQIIPGILDVPAVSTVTVPLGGVLTPLSFPTATANALGVTLPVTITGGTPLGGLIPGLLSIDSQLAHAITPIT